MEGTQVDGQNPLIGVKICMQFLGMGPILLREMTWAERQGDRGDSRAKRLRRSSKGSTPTVGNSTSRQVAQQQQAIICPPVIYG